jgi:hypothetical protein
MGENVLYTSYLSQKGQMQFLRQFKSVGFFDVQVRGVKNAPLEKNPG